MCNQSDVMTTRARCLLWLVTGILAVSSGARAAAPDPAMLMGMEGVLFRTVCEQAHSTAVCSCAWEKLHMRFTTPEALAPRPASPVEQFTPEAIAACAKGHEGAGS
jgi:hypothetical protein